MTATILGISAAYVLMGVLLLCMGLTSRFSWWVKAAVIVITSVFFVEAFYTTRGLLGWPGTDPLPAKFQLLWVRVVEPDAKIADPGSVYLWVEELDENNVPAGLPRAYRLPYTRPLSERASRAREQIMQGNPQQGSAEDVADNAARTETKVQMKRGGDQQNGDVMIDPDQAKLLQNAQRVEFAPMPLTLLPPKPPRPVPLER